RLIAKMVEFKRLERNGFWPSGDITASPKSMRTALSITGDLPINQATKAGPMDAPLVAALKSYQARNGLAADGKLGPATAKALETPLSDRITKLKVNIERRRWQNREAAGNLLYLNLADTALKLVRDDKTVGEIAVVRDDALFRDLPTFYGQVTAITRSTGGNLALSFEAENANLALPPKAKLVLGGNAAQNLSLLKPFMTEADGAKATAATLNEKIALAKPVPLFLTYLTAWATRDGTLQLRPDRYSRDGALKAKLGL
ncbi:MAG: peptidoglycan-binding protein, partial [Pseudomonadota bacterium]